jgi:hypothetical protein
MSCEQIARQVGARRRSISRRLKRAESVLADKLWWLDGADRAL